MVAHPPRNSPRRTLELVGAAFQSLKDWKSSCTLCNAQVSGAGSWGKVIDGNTRTYNPPALPRDLCPQVALIAEVHFGQKVISLGVVKGSLEDVHADLKRHISGSRCMVDGSDCLIPSAT